MKPAADQTVFIHERALCETRDIGQGTRVWAFAHIMEGASVGASCNVCDHVFIESGAIVGDRVTIKNNVLIWDKVVVEDDVFLGPGVVFTNDPNPRAEFKKAPEEMTSTLVRHGSTIGANATIVCGVEVGAYAFVGAGTVVTADVPPHRMIVGNPGRNTGWVCECGERLSEESFSCDCGRSYARDDDHGGLRRVGEGAS